MSSELAAGLSLLLCAFPVLALMLTAYKTSLFAPVGFAVAVAVIAIAFLQTGMLQQGNLASTEVSDLLAVQSLAGRCQETLDAVIEAQLVLARPTAEGLVVNADLWGQLPANLKEAIHGCAAELVESEGGAASLPIIAR